MVLYILKVLSNSVFKLVNFLEDSVIDKVPRVLLSHDTFGQIDKAASRIRQNIMLSLKRLKFIKSLKKYISISILLTSLSLYIYIYIYTNCHYQICWSIHRNVLCRNVMRYKIYDLHVS